ncbi:CD44 antigen isoform X10 [Ornithorhynchus anatinus]|uniref:CD44 antigen isoform X10 n=1 Tax=Ornithorhynchus anatinus TaxID=9258 RepID=UPI0019D41868|nr:CD44 antigen isoform X10 [Ornithorhynchus anatinus]
MTNFFWCATLGLCLVKLILAQIELNVTCRYAGVYHVEKNGRYSISRIEAEDLCKAFNCTLPTLEQMEKARKVGFQTCRYGFIDGHVVIPRITPNSLCAANNTGVYILPSNTSLYDTYCYNASAPEGVSCEPVTDLPSAFEGQITIGIVNPDGTRYTQKGEYRTHINETDPTLHPEDDGSSGSETNTQGSSTIIKTTYYSPDSYPDSDFYTTPSEWDMTSSPATTSMDSTTIKTGLESREDSDGSGNIGDDEDDNEHDLFSTTSASSRRISQETSWNEGWLPEDPIPITPEDQPHPTARTTDGNLQDNSTQDPLKGVFHPFSFFEDKSPIPTSTPMNNVSSEVTEVLFPGAPDSKEQQTDEDLHQLTKKPHADIPNEHGTNEGRKDAEPTSAPRRRPQIPEWLIILASLLALALILAVCIAVNSRRRCGQKKKLVINRSNGAVEERKMSGLNGDASKSQEMVHLVNKEPSDERTGQDEFTVTDETRNLQNVDMKIGM